MMGGYDSTREGAKRGSKGLPISINPSHFILMFISLELSKEALNTCKSGWWENSSH
jgi:hypothetical protein